MTNKFVDSMKSEDNKVLTDNGETAVKSTGSNLVDLFGTIGAMRDRDRQEVLSIFASAMEEDKLLALKTVFYARDIRGGLGERKVTRDIFKDLANAYPEIMKKNLHLVPEFGRWDDVYAFEGTRLHYDMWELIKNQMDQDLANLEEGKDVSLMAKWLKSVNTSSEESKTLGRATAKALGMSEKKYRKTLTKLRRYIDVVELKMTDKEWDKIDYSAVPSVAMNRYRTAFYRNDEERFEEFIGKVSTGEEKINAGALYPYNIMQGYGLNTWRRNITVSRDYDAVLEEQWKALPNFIEGEHNVLVMADTSGSMSGRPLDTSIGLGIYLAERNKGAFRNVLMTFSSEPSFVTLKGEKLVDKIRCIPAIVSNTDIEAAFDLILKTSLDNKVPQEDMPKALIIISDMEFDLIGTESYSWSGGPKAEWLFYDEMKKRFNVSGYEIPNIVFWNVDSNKNMFHAISEYKGVQMASGQSVATFKQILNNLDKTPYEAVLEVLNRPEYESIKI